MIKIIPRFPAALFALPIMLSASQAYAADPAVVSSSALPALSRALDAGLLPAEPVAAALLPTPRNVEQIASEITWEKRAIRGRAWRTQWLTSMAPLVASQSLDAASSWGLRELNPMLAGPDGRFGMKAASLKFGVIGGLLGAEYLIVKKFPGSTKFFTVVNYATTGVTTGLAMHNFALPGR